MQSFSVKITQNLKINTTTHKLHCLVRTDIYSSVTEGAYMPAFMLNKKASFQPVEISRSSAKPLKLCQHIPFRC